jgi:hypothetical protein
VDVLRPLLPLEKRTPEHERGECTALWSRWSSEVDSPTRKITGLGVSSGSETDKSDRPGPDDKPGVRMSVSEIGGRNVTEGLHETSDEAGCPPGGLAPVHVGDPFAGQCSAAAGSAAGGRGRNTLVTQAEKCPGLATPDSTATMPYTPAITDGRTTSSPRSATPSGSSCARESGNSPRSPGILTAAAGFGHRAQNRPRVQDDCRPLRTCLAPDLRRLALSQEPARVIPSGDEPGAGCSPAPDGRPDGRTG